MAVLTAVAAAVAGSLTSAVAGAALGGGGGGGGGMPSESPATTLNNIKNLTARKDAPKVTGETKAAATAKVPTVPGLLEDPWQPTKDWYKDLGGQGEPDFEGITL